MTAFHIVLVDDSGEHRALVVKYSNIYAIYCADINIKAEVIDTGGKLSFKAKTPETKKFETDILTQIASFVEPMSDSA